MEVKLDVPLLTSSIGKKLLMAVTGLGLTFFLFGHLAGNLLLLKQDGGVAFNEYAAFMKSSPPIWVSEILVFAGFVMHIIQGIRLTILNAKARPVGYKRNKGSANSTFYSRFMSVTGTILLIFLIIHLWSFFFKHKLLNLEPGVDLYTAVVLAFSNVYYTLFYVVAMVVLAFHLAHGVQSAVQTLGWQINPKVARCIQNIGYALAVLVPAAFAMVPLYILFATQGIF
ncbi:MAG: succinate dehydrogenase cytochrome b subunit [Bacteroidetes bacterium]|nr:succinate dehydrogenase cytochrome b subunit [Bacteroidota bacterium]